MIFTEHPSFVDTHFHVFDAGVGVAGSRYVPTYSASLASWREQSEPLGVGRGVLVQTSFMGTDNSRLVQELEAASGALRGVAVVSPNVSRPELLNLNEHGVRGIRLNWAGQSYEPGAWPLARSLWDAVLELGWHVELHTDVGFLPRVLGWMPRRVPVVLDHMGKPDQVLASDPSVRAVLTHAKTAPVYVKLSGAYRLMGRDPKALAQLWLSELGGEQLLWGSDWPHTNHEQQVDYRVTFQALFDWVQEREARQILVANPTRLYDLKEDF